MKIRKISFIILGLISLFLGIIGIFVPILPTTPFLLLTAFLFSKSSDKLHFWLLHNKLFGRYIRNYQSGKGIPLPTKISAVLMLWLGILSSVIFCIDSNFVKSILIFIAIFVSVHILGNPTNKRKEDTTF